MDFDGSETDFLVEHKGMPAEQVQQLLDQVTATGASAGVMFNFDSVRHTNTPRAHQALHHAAEHGLQSALLERLFRAYFTEGRHVGRDADLADLAAEVGLDRERLLADLAAARYATDVQRDINHAEQMGVRGVPFFVFEGEYGVSGAQSADTFRDVLSHVAAEVGTARACALPEPLPQRGQLVPHRTRQPVTELGEVL